MINSDFSLYCRWLNCGWKNDGCYENKFVQDSFLDTIKQSSAYQGDAEVNNKKQPLVATRKETNKCDVAVLPGDNLNIGDLVKVFNEHWLCIEKYIDEYGMQYAELWMCNHVFCYQNFNLDIINKYAILDDGSYSKGNEKALAITDNSFNCYISLDDESRSLFIDKRLGISVIYDKNGQEILEVGKIKWIDIKSHNFGDGSHLMVFGINEDPYNPSTDSIEKLICDYKEKDKENPPTGEISGQESENTDKNTTQDDGDVSSINKSLIISGRKNIRTGTGRTYTVSAINGGATTDAPLDLEWKVEGDGVSCDIEGASCKIVVQENNDLVGSVIVIRCHCLSGEYLDATLSVEVI